MRKHLKSGAENLAKKHKQKAIDLHFALREMVNSVPEGHEEVIKNTLTYQALSLKFEWQFFLFDFYDKLSKLL